MKLLDCSSVPINSLIGALLVNEHGAEFYIKDIRLSLDDLTPWITIATADCDEDQAGIPFTPERMKSWSIQLGNRV